MEAKQENTNLTICRLEYNEVQNFFHTTEVYDKTVKDWLIVSYAITQMEADKFINDIDTLLDSKYRNYKIILEVFKKWISLH